MPTWGGILSEIGARQRAGDPAPFDTVRRRYMSALHAHTGRNLVLYASRFMQPGLPMNEGVMLNDEDLEGVMEVVHGLQGSELDLIIHSPGGSAEATEALVQYLRSKFSDIRVIVPHLAMSAATMWACSANRIVMGRHSFLGPVDPQVIFGDNSAPAQAILDQFALARKECRDPSNLAPWAPILEQYGPALLVQCKNALNLSRELVRQWLREYMFAGQSRRSEKARKVATALSNFRYFKSHGRHIGRDQVRLLGGVGLVIENLETDQQFQDLVLSVYHATMHTLSATGAIKIIENHQGPAFVKQIVQIVAMPRPPSGGPSGAPPASPPPPPPGPP